MPKYVLNPSYLAELKQFIQKLTDPLQIEVVKNYHSLCADYINNNVQDKSVKYDNSKSTAFIVKAKYGLRAHLFTRVFNETPYKLSAVRLGIMNFDAPSWKALKDKQVSEVYIVSIEDGKVPLRGNVLYRTKSVKQKNWISAEEHEKKLRTQYPRNPSKKKKTLKSKSDKYKTYKFTPEGSDDPVYFKKKISKTSLKD